MSDDFVRLTFVGYKKDCNYFMGTVPRKMCSWLVLVLWLCGNIEQRSLIELPMRIPEGKPVGIVLYGAFATGTLPCKLPTKIGLNEIEVKCCEVFFETLNAPALCVKPQSFLALFGSGLTTGLSVDMGEEVTEVNPIYEGGSISYANMLTNVAGCDVKGYIRDRLQKRDIDLGHNPESVINGIWRLAYVTENCAVTKQQYKKEYTLPNGEVIDVSEEVFMAAEMYFQPELVIGKKTDKLPIHEAVVTAILKVDAGLQPEMYDSIVTHGGMLSTPGFNKRLAREIEAIIHRPVNILTSTETYSVAWMGGAVFAGMMDAPKLWVHQKQYEEYGEKIVRAKFEV